MLSHLTCRERLILAFLCVMLLAGAVLRNAARHSSLVRRPVERAVSAAGPGE